MRDVRGGGCKCALQSWKCWDIWTDGEGAREGWHHLPIHLSFLSRHNLCVYVGIMLKSYFGGVRRERKKREEAVKRCSAQLHKALSEKYFSVKSQAASAAEILINTLERPRWTLCSSPGCHGPRLSYPFCTSRFRLLVGDILRVLQGRRDGESLNSWNPGMGLASETFQGPSGGGLRQLLGGEATASIFDGYCSKPSKADGNQAGQSPAGPASGCKVHGTMLLSRAHILSHSFQPQTWESRRKTASSG